MVKVIATIAVLLAALIAAVAMDKPAPRASLTFIDSQDFLTVDPQRVSYMQDIRMVYALFEGLTRNDVYSKDFDVVPALARTWEVSSDKRIYTFHLEPTAKWSNGDPVRASDFVYAWQRAVEPETIADYAGLIMKLKGARAFFEWRQNKLKDYAARPSAEKSMEAARQLREEANQHFRATVGVEALDDHTLRVTLERPVTYFLDLVGFAAFYPVHPATVERFISLNPETGEIIQNHGWTKPPVLVSNGPYELKVWKFKREARIERNPFYWNKSAVKSDTVCMLPIEDANTGVLAFETGAADWHCDVTADYIPEMLAQVKRGERDDFAAFPTFGTYFWNFNCTERFADGRLNPFHDPRVRRAFCMAVNKQDLVDKVKRGGERVSNVLVPVGSIRGFHSPVGLSYDPAGARKLLAEAGWPGTSPRGVPMAASGEEFPVVELLVTAVQYHKDVAQAMGRMWEQALGVRSTIAITEAKNFKQRLRERDYMMSRANWWGDYGDPTTFLDLHRSTDGNNDRGYSSPKFDALMTAADNEPDESKRMRLLEEAERLTMEEDLPILPLWQNNYYYMFHPPEKDGRPNPGGLRGISTHPRLLQYYWQMEVVK